MRLLTHNFLKSHTSASVSADALMQAPLTITATQIEVTDEDFDENAKKFTTHILKTLSWPILCKASQSLGLTALPNPLPPALAENPDFLKALHHLLIHVHVVRGMLTCDKTGREFKIDGGVADFMIEEEECVNVKG